MSSRKLPSKFSDEDLIKALNSVPESPEDNKDPEVSVEGHDILGFLTHYKIEPGTHKVKVKFLYKLYKEWSQNSVNSSIFGSFVNGFFERHQHYYYINKDYFTICRELYILLNENRVNKLNYPAYQKHFEHFLQVHNIKQGTFWVEHFILFYIYDKWSYKNKKSKPLGYNSFFNFCCLYLKHKRKTANRVEWFAVDESILNYITKEKIEEIRLARAKFYDKNYKKRAIQVPRPRPKTKPKNKI